MEALESAGKVRCRNGYWYEAGTPIRVLPCLVPMRTPGRTDMDSGTACTAFRHHLDELLRRERPHLLHVHLVRHRIQVVALEAARNAGIPTVITHHEGRPATQEMAEILRESYRLADRVCAVTRFSAAAFGGPRVDYRGFFVDRDFWNPDAVADRDRDAWRRRLAPGAMDRLLVYPARFIPRKNHEFLIRGMAGLVRSRAMRGRPPGRSARTAGSHPAGRTSLQIAPGEAGCRPGPGGPRHLSGHAFPGGVACSLRRL